MKKTNRTVETYMSEAKAKKYDVVVQDAEGWWQFDGAGWRNLQEGCWYSEAGAFEGMAVLRVEMWTEEKTMVLVVEED